MKDIWENITFEVNYFWRFSIRYPIKRFFVGMQNFKNWFLIIYNDRWWDYDFLLEIILFKLKQMEKHWGKDTNQERDYEVKEILKSLIHDLELAIYLDNHALTKKEKEAAQRTRTRFFTKLDRHLIKLWD